MADEIEELVSEDVQCMSHDIRESMIIKANEKTCFALPTAIKLHSASIILRRTLFTRSLSIL